MSGYDHAECRVLDAGCSVATGLWAVAHAAKVYRDVRTPSSWDHLIDALAYLDEAQNNQNKDSSPHDVEGK